RQGFGLFWDAAEAAYQTKNFDLAKQMLDVLDAHPLEPLRRAQVLGKRLQIVTFNREGDALGLTLAALRRFGVRWPRRPSRLRIRWEVFRTDWALRGPLDANLFPRGDTPEQDRSWLAPTLVFRGAGAAMVRESSALACFASAYS